MYTYGQHWCSCSKLFKHILSLSVEPSVETEFGIADALLLRFSSIVVFSNGNLSYFEHHLYLLDLLFQTVFKFVQIQLAMKNMLSMKFWHTVTIKSVS